MELPDLENAVRLNCNISDAQYAGAYSICTLALRLRDLYKWEKGLAPWEEGESGAVLDWIGDREEIWEGLSGKSFEPLVIQGNAYDPFDAGGVNAVLAPYGLIYGAGYALGLKPTFFLAVHEQTIHRGETTIHLLGQELARDLLTLPAMAQNGVVLLRKSCAGLYLWDEILYIRKSARPALAFALKAMGMDGADLQSVKKRFADVFNAQMDLYVLHEIGEINDHALGPDVWREIVAAFPHTPTEFVTRAVKDMLADTHADGTLPQIIAKQDAAALGFYFAFLGQLADRLFPDLKRGFQSFLGTHRWETVDGAVAMCRDTAHRYAAFITDAFMTGKADGELQKAEKTIESNFIGRLKHSE